MTRFRCFELPFSLFRLAALFVVFVPSFLSIGYAQLPGDPIIIDPGNPGDPGNPPPPLTLSLSASPNPVLVGHTVTVMATATGGTPPYSFGWGRACVVDSQDPEDMVLEISPAAAPPGNSPHVYQFCSPSPTSSAKVGIVRCYCVVTDSLGQSEEATVDVEFLPPDTLKIHTGSVNSTPHQGPGSPMTGTHKFVLRRGNEEVGPCLIANASEKFWALGQDEPDEWGFQGGLPNLTNNFFFHSPYIYDVRVWYFYDQTVWDGVPNGTTLFDAHQRVKVDVPKCDNTFIEVKSGTLRYRVRKFSASRVKFIVTSS